MFLDFITELRRDLVCTLIVLLLILKKYISRPMTITSRRLETMNTTLLTIACDSSALLDPFGAARGAVNADLGSVGSIVASAAVSS